MSNQPDGMVADNGVLLTIGLVVNSDRAAIVLPMCCAGSSTLTPDVLCPDIINAMITGAGPSMLQNIMGSSSYISYFSAEGMIDGRIPRRQDYDPLAWPGSRGPCVSSQVAALMGFYEDPADSVVGQRMRLGKNFIPGIASNDMVGDLIIDDLQSLIQSFATFLQLGFPSVADPSVTWYRVLAAPKVRTAGTPIRRTITGGPRGYVVTQRRRLIPRL